MVANHLLEIYTLLFGWAMYEAIWDILVGTGLVYIPFFAVLLQMFVESRDPLKSVKGAQSTLEFRLIGIFVVLILLVIPWRGGGGTQISDFRYEISSPFCHGTDQLGHSTSGQADNTGTANDTSFGSMMSGYQVHPPLGWSLVMVASTAITNSSIASISCVNNYNFLLARIANIKIPLGDVRNRIEDFSEVCYQPALAEYNAKSKDTPVPLGSSIIDKPNWLGSTLFLDTANQYYQREGAFMAYESGAYNFTNNPTLRTHDAIEPALVKPTCKQVWEGDGSLPLGASSARINQSLRDTIYHSIPDDDIGNVRDDWETWGSAMFGTLSPTQERALLVQMLLTADSVKPNSTPLAYQADGFSTDGFFTSALKDMASLIPQAIDGVGKMAEYRITMLIAPYIGMFIQMLIVIAAPFVLVSNGYSFSAFVGLAMAWFSVEFLNFIWATISWFNTHLFDLFMDFNQSQTFSEIWGALRDGDNAGISELSLIYQLPNYLAIILPAVWLILSGMMGSKVMNALGSSATGSAAGSAAGGVVSGLARSAAGPVASKASAAGKGLAKGLMGKKK